MSHTSVYISAVTQLFSCEKLYPTNMSSCRATGVSSAPGAGVSKSGPVSTLCGSTQIREELFIRDCGVLSFTTTYFPSFHHATFVPTHPRIFPPRPGQKHVFGFKYCKYLSDQKKIHLICILCHSGLFFAQYGHNITRNHDILRDISS